MMCLNISDLAFDSIDLFRSIHTNQTVNKHKIPIVIPKGVGTQK